ncbi:MAG: 1-deoxy-D-xylulose-5-phosphate reductoisomerase, partial [Bacteroidales bacterium]
MKKQIAILGSTGSIGRQTLEVIAEHSDLFEVSVLTANNSADLLIRQARTFIPDIVVIANEKHYNYVTE